MKKILDRPRARRISEFSFGLIVVAGLAWAAGPASALEMKAGKGELDITGVWQRYPVYTLGFTDPDNDPNANRDERPFVTPPRPEPPLKPVYLKEWKDMQQKAREANARGQPINSQVVNCLPEGMPTMMGPTFPIEFLQTKNQITMIEEAYTQVRRVYMNEKLPSPDEVDPSFYGTSVGHWDSGVLTIQTVGVKEDIKVRGVPHSSNMKITEKIKYVAPDILWNEITVEDPEYLEKPWTWTNAYVRMPGYRIDEYICENNKEYIDENGVQRSNWK